MKARVLLSIMLAILLLGMLTIAVSADEPEITITVAPLVPPTVIVHDATGVTPVSGTLQGEILLTGNNDPHTRGFEWGFSTGNYTQSWNETGSFGIGAFSHTVGNLTLGLEVFFRAFAINTIGTAYSGEESFVTLELPLAPTDFVISEDGPSSINITWILGIGADTTVIRGSSDGYPTLTGGYEVYNGNGTSVALTDLNLESGAYYYRAWSHNSYGYSLDYAQAKKGGMMVNAMLLIALLFFPLSFTGFYAWKREVWMGITASVGWVCMGLYLMLDFSSSPSPSQITDIWMGLAWFCMALAIVFALASFVWKSVIQESWEEGEDELGQPVMVQYIKGNETGRSRGLTDIETRNREQRIKEQQEARTKPKIKPSNFAQNGKIS